MSADTTKIIDAEGHIAGRLCSQISKLLLNGNRVIVVNAEKVHVSGKKEEDKMYYHHTGYPGGIKSAKYYELQEKYPERIVEGAVKGMMPKNTLNRRSLLRLKVYSGSEHPHESQQPQPLNI